jgi:2-(1,2-epoxy-1,2-dihydrophenyl)acetyl-CoA isomerase
LVETRERGLSEPPVLDERQDGVAFLTLNRPAVLNAINDEMMEALVAATRAVAADESVRCVVVTGAGRGFCSGGDLKNRSAVGEQPVPRPTPGERTAFLRSAFEAARLLHEIPKPTIAMVNGPCAGAGVGLAGACDLRFAARSASIRTAFVEVGLAGDYGTTWFWTRLLGSAKAREFLFLSEKFDAQGALEFGLFTRVFDDGNLRERTMDVARLMAARNPWAYRLAKDSLNQALVNELSAQLGVEAVNSVAAAGEIRRARREARDAKSSDRP